MNQEKFEAQCHDDLDRLIKKFGEEREDEIIDIYNRIKNKMAAEAKIFDYLSVLIEKEFEKETKNLLTENKILNSSLA